MSDREAFLAAIRANPDEDTPRLVYADWLEENGQAKRAAFIRTEIARFQQTHANTEANAVYAYLDTRLSTALDRIDWTATDGALGERFVPQKQTFRLKEKAEGIPQIKGVSFSEHNRGFFDAAHVADTAAFLRHAEDIFRSAPITNVTIDVLTAGQAHELVDAGHLGHIRELLFNTSVEPEAVRVLGMHKDAMGIRKLAFDTSSISGDVVEALTAGKYWSGLESFDIVNAEDSVEPPEEEQLTELFSRKQFRGIRTLLVWGCNLNNDIMKVIAKNMPDLRHIDAALNRITGGGAAAFASTKSLRHLRYLDLSSCDIEDPEPATALINSPALPNLTVLRLDGNSPRGLHTKTLAKPSRGPCLRVLDLGWVGLNPTSAKALAQCPATHGLWVLDMQVSQSESTPDVLEPFFRNAAFDRLTVLDATYCRMTAPSAKALAEWPGSASLQWLDIGGNAVGAAGAKSLADSPHLTKLKYLNTTGRGVALLKKRFKRAFG